MDVKIEKGVPVPPNHKKMTVEWINTFKKMAIGDSFTCQKRDSAIAVRAALTAGMKAVSRLVEGETYRVWRIAPEAKKS